MYYKVVRWEHWPIPKNMQAITIMAFIFIRKLTPSYIMPHEKVHVRQFYSDWLFPFKYLLSAEYKYKAEIEAYAVSIKAGQSTYDAASALQSGYSLKKTYSQIYSDLQARVML